MPHQIQEGKSALQTFDQAVSASGMSDVAVAAAETSLNSRYSKEGQAVEYGWSMQHLYTISNTINAPHIIGPFHFGKDCSGESLI